MSSSTLPAAAQVDPMITVTVAERIAEAEDIVVFELIPAGPDALPPFEAGAHIDVEVAPGLFRQYSLCNDPAERHRYVVAVLKDPASRGGSIAMHALERGAQVRVSIPRNHFSLEPSATRSVLLAGGIGVTPLLCMAEHLDTIGADFDLHYCSRSPSRAAFRSRIAASRYAERVHFHFDDGDPAQRLDLDAVLASPAPGVHLYVCGPSKFMDVVTSAAAASGFAGDHVHRECFAPAAVQAAANAAFQVKLSSTSRVIDIPAGRTVLATLRDAGVELLACCEEGVCGSCLTRVLDGIPDHRDSFLTPQEREKGDQFTPCCSRSKTPVLVLDL